MFNYNLINKQLKIRNFAKQVYNDILMSRAPIRLSCLQSASVTQMGSLPGRGVPMAGSGPKAFLT